jgi:cell division transport system ATP-binding protein
MKKETAHKAMVEIVRATKIYPPDVIALEGLSLSVPSGETLFLTGMSGAGKTTLLKLICGIEHPDKGLVEVAGRDLNRIKAREIPRFRQQIGMAYQDFKLLADRTVAQNIAMAMEVAYHNFGTIRERVNELLARLTDPGRRTDRQPRFQVDKACHGTLCRVQRFRHNRHYCHPRQEPLPG